MRPLPNTLYRNNGDGTFTDVSAETGIAKYFGKGMGVVIADYDGDGFMDIFVANDNRPNFLFHNLGGKKFEEVALEAGVAYARERQRASPAWAPISETSITTAARISGTQPSRTNPSRYFVTQGGGQFVERNASAQLAETRTMSGWSNGIFDFDNDGWKDLFVARSNVLDNASRFPTAATKSRTQSSAISATVSFRT